MSATPCARATCWPSSIRATCAAQARAAQAQLAAAEAELARARADQARFAKLASEQLVSRSDAATRRTPPPTAAQGQANAARAKLDVARNQAAYTQLRAPRDGVIASRAAPKPGRWSPPARPCSRSPPTAGAKSRSRCRKPHPRLQRRPAGRWWNCGAQPGQRLPGTIREIAAAADPQARTYAARVSLAGDAAEAVELGQSARVYVQDNGDARR